MSEWVRGFDREPTRRVDWIDVGLDQTTYCGNGGGNCVKVAAHGGMILVPDTKDHGHGPVHRFTADAWRKFADKLKAFVSARTQPRKAGAVYMGHSHA